MVGDMKRHKITPPLQPVCTLQSLFSGLWALVLVEAVPHGKASKVLQKWLAVPVCVIGCNQSKTMREPPVWELHVTLKIYTSP